MVRKVLLGEESAAVQNLIEEHLINCNMKVLKAENGKKLLRMARDTQPDIIIVANTFGTEDGYQIFRRIKEDPNISHIPVLLLVDSSEPLDPKVEADMELAGIITKPIDGSILVKKVVSLIIGETEDTVKLKMADVEDLSELELEELDIDDEEILELTDVVESPEKGPVGEEPEDILILEEVVEEEPQPSEEVLELEFDVKEALEDLEELVLDEEAEEAPKEEGALDLEEPEISFEELKGKEEAPEHRPKMEEVTTFPAEEAAEEISPEEGWEFISEEEVREEVPEGEELRPPELEESEEIVLTEPSGEEEPISLEALEQTQVAGKEVPGSLDLQEIPLSSIEPFERRPMELSLEDFGVLGGTSEEGLRIALSPYIEGLVRKVVEDMAPAIIQKVVKEVTLEKAESLLMEEIERLKETTVK